MLARTRGNIIFRPGAAGAQLKQHRCIAKYSLAAFAMKCPWRVVLLTHPLPPLLFPADARAEYETRLRTGGVRNYSLARN